MATKIRRPQKRKGATLHDIYDVSQGNKAYMRGMQDIRRSNAATPIPSGKKYKRTVKHRSKMFQEA